MNMTQSLCLVPIASKMLRPAKGFDMSLNQGPCEQVTGVSLTVSDMLTFCEMLNSFLRSVINMYQIFITDNAPGVSYG